MSGEGAQLCGCVTPLCLLQSVSKWPDMGEMSPNLALWTGASVCVHVCVFAERKRFLKNPRNVDKCKKNSVNKIKP